jgi:hypothetical protein
MLLYVDDIVLITYSTRLLQHFTMRLHIELDITDLGALHHFLGIFVKRSTDDIFLS